MKVREVEVGLASKVPENVVFNGRTQLLFNLSDLFEGSQKKITVKPS